MTVLSHECLGVSGSLDIFGVPFPIIVPLVGCCIAFLWGWLIHGDGLDVLFSVFCAIGRALRPVGCGFRWVYHHLFRIFACAAVLTSISGSLFSVYLSLNGSVSTFAADNAFLLLGLASVALVADKFYSFLVSARAE